MTPLQIRNRRTPDAAYDRKAMLDKLKKLIGDLDERDRLILTLYYFEDMTLSEIGLLLDRSEARISQIVGKLIMQMRHAMKKRRCVFPVKCHPRTGGMPSPTWCPFATEFIHRQMPYP